MNNQKATDICVYCGKTIGDHSFLESLSCGLKYGSNEKVPTSPSVRILSSDTRVNISFMRQVGENKVTYESYITSTDERTLGESIKKTLDEIEDQHGEHVHIVIRKTQETLETISKDDWLNKYFWKKVVE